MGYAWAETITAESTRIKSSHVTELQANIDDARGLVSLAGYTWTRVPAAGQQIKDNKGAGEEYFEMRAALDEADDANFCSAHNLSHLDVQNTTHNPGYLLNDNGTYDGTHQGTHNGTHQHTHNNNVDSTENAADDTTNNSTHESGDRTAHNSYRLVGYNSGEVA